MTRMIDERWTNTGTRTPFSQPRPSVYLDDVVERLAVLAVEPELVLADPVHGAHPRLIVVAAAVTAPLAVIIVLS